MNAVCKNEYSQKVKQREIILYIFENGENFDLKDLANHMEMTYGQLRKQIKILLEKEILVVKDGVLKLSVIYENIYIKKEAKSLEKSRKDDIMEKKQIYLPKDFRNKFSGYS
jgi:DNA-binding MarR family transcriptional regulator